MVSAFYVNFRFFIYFNFKFVFLVVVVLTLSLPLADFSGFPCFHSSGVFYKSLEDLSSSVNIILCIKKVKKKNPVFFRV